MAMVNANRVVSLINTVHELGHIHRHEVDVKSMICTFLALTKEAQHEIGSLLMLYPRKI